MPPVRVLYQGERQTEHRVEESYNVLASGRPDMHIVKLGFLAAPGNKIVLSNIRDEEQA